MAANPEAPEAPGAAGEVRVWDPLVRVFHWTLAAAFLGAQIWEDPRVLHESLGWIAGGAVAVRLVWGLIGSRHARFADFVPSPAGFFGYVRDVAQGRERRYLGHNPAGGAMVLALLATVLGLVATGWMMGLDAFWGVDWVEEAHETLAHLGLFLVALHLAGVIWEGRRHGENLVAAMVTGRKRR
jgi:cytochrome b